MIKELRRYCLPIKYVWPLVDLKTVPLFAGQDTSLDDVVLVTAAPLEAVVDVMELLLEVPPVPVEDAVL